MPKFAAVQMEPVLLQSQENLCRIIHWLHEAVRLGAQVVVFPECVLSGYALSAEEAHRLAEPIPGPSIQKIIRECAQSGILTSIGMIERGPNGHCYNAAVLIGPMGVIGHYRKTHLPYLGVDRYLRPGQRVERPFNSPFGRLGLLVCYDLRFPEPMRVLSLQGAQIVLLSTAWPKAAALYPDFMARTRSAENGIYLVAANRIGEERGTTYLGRSIITGPDGELLAEASAAEEMILLADIDPRRSDQKDRIFIPGEYELHLFKDRRPEIYSALTE
jgi:predicted amidohydrolase